LNQLIQLSDDELKDRLKDFTDPDEYKQLPWYHRKAIMAGLVFDSSSVRKELNDDVIFLFEKNLPHHDVSGAGASTGGMEQCYLNSCSTASLAKFLKSRVSLFSIQFFITNLIINY
jgi:hypothetical protein